MKTACFVLIIFIALIPMLTDGSPSQHATCPTRILVGLNSIDILDENPVQIFSHNVRAAVGRENRAKKITNLEKYLGNCATVYVPVESGHDDVAPNSYSRIGFRAKDDFIFLTAQKGNIDAKIQLEDFRNASLLQNGKVVKRADKKYGDSKVKLSGRSIKVAAVRIPPLVMFGKAGKNRPWGSFMTLFEDVARQFNFSIEMDFEMFRRGGQGRPMKNGTWSGVIGGLKRGEVDVTFMGHQVSRYPHADFTTMLHSDASSFLIKRPGVRVRWTALLDPWQWPVWIGTVISFVLVSICYFVVLKVTGVQKERIYRSIIHPLSVVFEQDASVPSGTRILMYSWVWTILILETGYKDKLMMFLTFPETEPIPHEIKDFVNDFRDYRLIQAGWLISFQLNNSNDPNIVQLKDRFEFKSAAADCVVPATLNEKTACIGYYQFMGVGVASNLTVHPQFFAPVKSNGGVIPGIPVSFGLPKDSSMTADWDVIAGMYRDSGIYERVKKDTITKLKLEGMKKRKEGPAYEQLMEMMRAEGMTVQPLHLRDFATLFVLVALLEMVCIGVFLNEIGVGRRLLRSWTQARLLYRPAQLILRH